MRGVRFFIGFVCCFSSCTNDFTIEEDIVNNKSDAISQLDTNAILSETTTGSFTFSGEDFSDWNITLGDARYVSSGESDINNDDIETLNFGDQSVLYANIKERSVMSHNITYKKLVSSQMFDVFHKASYQFKIPYQIRTRSVNYIGQTVEGGLFVSNGRESMLDFGLAFQWIINPWDSNFGVLQYWTGNSWKYLDKLSVDTQYHDVEFELHVRKEEAYMTIDKKRYSLNLFSYTEKSGFGNTMDARLQAEIVSIFPNQVSKPIPSHQVAFKNWNWKGDYIAPVIQP